MTGEERSEWPCAGRGKRRKPGGSRLGWQRGQRLPESLRNASEVLTVAAHTLKQTQVRTWKGFQRSATWLA